MRPKSLPFLRDEDHAEVARAAATKSRLGVLFVAGPMFTPLHYIDRVAELGFHFVRLAVMPGVPHEDILPYVTRAKGHGLVTAINLMQTYARSPGAVAEVAKKVAGEGADWFFIVDSAGGMKPDEVKQYVSAILGRAELEVGLHSHNNIGVAVFNGLAAVEAGATLVDGSMNGIGRSTGNSPTEQLAVSLRNRLAHDVDLGVLTGLGRAVRSLFDDAGNDPFDVVSGGARLHSRNVPRILEIASERGLDPSEFLLEVGREGSERDILSEFVFSAEVYDAAAERTRRAAVVTPSNAVVKLVAEDIRARWNAGALRTIEHLLLRKKQHHKPSVLHLSRAAHGSIMAPVHWEQGFVGVTIPWNGEALQIDASRRPDVLLLDDDGPEAPIEPLRQTWRVSLGEVQARALADLARVLRNHGFVLWIAEAVGDVETSLLRPLGVAQGGGRPSGRVALVSGLVAQPEERLLQEGDCVVVPPSMPAERVGPLRSRGVRVLEPDWSTTIAQMADVLDGLGGALERGDEHALLTERPFARGPGQARWDSRHAAILEADDSSIEEAAHRAALEQSRGLWRGLRRF